jgi:hypothetical protein
MLKRISESSTYYLLIVYPLDEAICVPKSSRNRDKYRHLPRLSHLFGWALAKNLLCFGKYFGFLPKIKLISALAFLYQTSSIQSKNGSCLIC